MRKLSTTFLTCLKSGFLSPITKYAKADHDLNLEIREGYINIYYKGNSLLQLSEVNSLLHYKGNIHPKFLKNVEVPLDLTEETVPDFIKCIPLLKENINKYGERSLEMEYEQSIIRSNNFESRNTTEYFMVDRQYALGDARFDLTGIFWDRNNRQRNREAQVCLMEVKYALNSDIQDVHNQLARYYAAIRERAAEIAEEMEVIFQQKLKLGLYDQDAVRLKAMKALKFSRNIDAFQFIVVLVDYNENSVLLDPQKLRQLPFSSQIRIFRTGFGMWQQNVTLL